MIYMWHIIDLVKETSFVVRTNERGAILDNGAPELNIDEFINWPNRFDVMLLKRGDYDGKKAQERKLGS